MSYEIGITNGFTRMIDWELSVDIFTMLQDSIISYLSIKEDKHLKMYQNGLDKELETSRRTSWSNVKLKSRNQTLLSLEARLEEIIKKNGFISSM